MFKHYIINVYFTIKIDKKKKIKKIILYYYLLGMLSIITIIFM